MKKAFALLLCILFILSLGGCQYLKSTPIASHTGEFALPAGSSLPSASSSAPALSVPTSAGDSFAFRKTNWGMTKDEVIASEGRQPDELAGERISYAKKMVLNRECDLFYIFSGGLLSSGGYEFTEDDPGSCITDYNDIVTGLTGQSVFPSSAQTLWSNGEFKSDPQKYGLAVLLGDLTYQTSWVLTGTTVTCELHASASDGAHKAVVTAAWQSPASVRTASPSPSPTQTASPTPSASASVSATPSATVSASASATESASASPSVSPSASPDDSPEPLPSLIALPSASPSEASGFAFRNTNWGISKDAVIASEDKQPDKTSGDIVTYEDETFQDRDCTLFYTFGQNMLQTGGYDMPEKTGKSIADYNAMVDSLTKGYGSPAVSEQIWINTQSKNDPSVDLGTAVAAGDVVLRSVWYTDQATISCVLYRYGKQNQKKTAMTVSFQNPQAATADIETLPGYSFRQTNWGMSMYQVITTEGRQPDEKGADYLIYKNEKYHNADCHIIYQFANGSLASGSYMIYNMHTDPNDYIKDYNTAVAILRQSYGASAANNQIWNNPASRYKNDPGSFGLAVLRGDLSISSEWALHQAVIDCSVSLANTIVAIDITYKQPAQ